MGWLRERRFVVTLAAVYVVGLVALVVGPWGWELNRSTVWLYATFRYDWAVAPGWVRPDHYGIALNVVLFVPLGAVLTAFMRWSWWRSTFVCMLASVLIELGQWRWLEREGAGVDVLANTVGGLLGAAAVTWVTRARSGPGAGSARARRR